VGWADFYVDCRIPHMRVVFISRQVPCGITELAVWLPEGYIKRYSGETRFGYGKAGACHLIGARESQCLQLIACDLDIGGCLTARSISSRTKWCEEVLRLSSCRIERPDRQDVTG
jgi:hypothetical protein